MARRDCEASRGVYECRVKHEDPTDGSLAVNYEVINEAIGAELALAGYTGVNEGRRLGEKRVRMVSQLAV